MGALKESTIKAAMLVASGMSFEDACAETGANNKTVRHYVYRNADKIGYSSKDRKDPRTLKAIEMLKTGKFLISEAAKKNGISRGSLYNAVNRMKLTGYKTGHPKVVTPEADKMLRETKRIKTVQSATGIGYHTLRKYCIQNNIEIFSEQHFLNIEREKARREKEEKKRALLIEKEANRKSELQHIGGKWIAGAYYAWA